jgi:hypothetical protein
MTTPYKCAAPISQPWNSANRAEHGERYGRPGTLDVQLQEKGLLPGIFSCVGQNDTPRSQIMPEFRGDLIGIEIAPVKLNLSIHGLHLEVFMIRTHSIALPVIWLLALAIFSGCQDDRINNIPSNATVAASGDSHLTYTPTTDGTVWVYDVNNDRIDYSGSLMANQSLVINPDTKQILIDARVVSDKTMSAGDQHRIYFIAKAEGGGM